MTNSIPREEISMAERHTTVSEMRRRIWAGLLALLFLPLSQAGAQRLPEAEGERERCGIQIEFGRAYVSGVCVMLREEGLVKASVVNEFGVSFMDFSYSEADDRVRLLSVAGKLDKWYIRRMLRKDLLQLMHAMRRGETTYRGKRAVYSVMRL